MDFILRFFFKLCNRIITYTYYLYVCICMKLVLINIDIRIVQIYVLYNIPITPLFNGVIFFLYFFIFGSKSSYEFDLIRAVSMGVMLYY